MRYLFIVSFNAEYSFGHYKGQYWGIHMSMSNFRSGSDSLTKEQVFGAVLTLLM